MKSLIRGIADPKGRDDALMFCCPGCASTREGYEGLHMLPISGDSNLRPTWTFDGNLLLPTLSPSILTRFNWEGKEIICHSFLQGGVFNFLGDSTHALSGKHVPIPDLPLWVDKEGR